MYLQYVETAPTGRCGTDWLVIDVSRWKCVRRTSFDRLKVIASGQLTPGDTSIWLLRKPVAFDPRVLVVEGQSSVFAFDVDAGTQLLGRLPSNVFGPLIDADVDGDGRPEKLSQDGRILSMPGGSAPPFEWIGQLDLSPVIAAQVDDDAQQEVGWVDADRRLRFRDPISRIDDPFRPSYQYFRPGPASRWDWDGDGRDEVAITDCCPASLHLLDPNGSSVSLATQSPDTATPLTIMDWGNPSRRSAVFATVAGLVVVDVSSGQAEAFGVHQILRYPQAALTTDWDSDGDKDVLWVNQDANATLWLLRNPSGPEVLQHGAVFKRPLGSIVDGARHFLVALEEFSGPEGSPLVLRTRDADTLEIVNETDIGRGNAANDQVGIGDLHPRAGMELVRLNENAVMMSSFTGAGLWETVVSNPATQYFAGLAVPDFTCLGDGCRQVFFTQAERANASPTLRLLDGLTGQNRWVLEGLASGGRTLAMTDLNEDGWPELLYREDRGLVSRLVARDGQSHEVLWRTDFQEFALQIRRTIDEARRLVVLGGSGRLSYLDPLTGVVLRQLQVGRYCSGCSIEYLAQGKVQGLWIISGVESRDWVAVRRDLRGVEWRDSIAEPARFTTGVPDRIYSGRTEALFEYRVPVDQLFADEMEGW